MENLKTLVWEFRFVLVTIVAFAVYAVFEWQRVKVKAYAIMLQAKSKAKDAILKSGKEQEEWVVKKLYQFLPVQIRAFISQDLLLKIVGYLYLKAKDYLDNAEINNSISE